MNILTLHQILKRLIVKFLSIIGLKIDRFSSPFQYLFEGIRHGLSRFAFHRLNPSVFGQQVHHRQEITVSSIVLVYVNYLDQICCPLLVNTTGFVGNRRRLGLCKCTPNFIPGPLRRVCPRCCSPWQIASSHPNYLV